MKRIVFFLCTAVLMSGTALAEEKAEGRVDRIKAGEWAVYKMMGRDDVTQRHTVVAIEGEGDEAVVVFSAAVYAEDKLINQVEMRRTKAEMRREEAETAKKILRKETVTINGKEIEAEVAVDVVDGVEFTYYGSNDLPVNGVIRMERAGVPYPLSELIDYGFE